MFVILAHLIVNQVHFCFCPQGNVHWYIPPIFLVAEGGQLMCEAVQAMGAHLWCVPVHPYRWLALHCWTNCLRGAALLRERYYFTTDGSIALGPVGGWGILLSVPSTQK